MSHWIVQLDGYVDETFEADTKPKATWAAFKALREAYPSISFRDFLSRLQGVRPETNGERWLREARC